MIIGGPQTISSNQTIYGTNEQVIATRTYIPGLAPTQTLTTAPRQLRNEREAAQMITQQIHTKIIEKLPLN